MPSLRGHSPPTLAHVALRAGVSKATASAVLSGAPGPAVETAARVRRAAQELGYRSRIGARALRTGLNSTVAVVLDPTTMDRRLQVDTFWAKLVNSVVLTCSAEGVPVMLVAAEDATALAGQAVDAVLFISDGVSIDEFEALGFGLPLVKIEMGDRADDRLTTVLRLDVDSCVREVMDAMLDAGYLRPAVVYGRERSLFTQVELSYQLWCSDRGIEPTVIENADPHDDPRCVAEASELIERGVDGFFTYMTDPVNIVRAGLNTGRCVPTDVGLIAQGDETSIPFWDVGLSNVSFLGTQAGAIAGRALIDAVSGQGSRESELPYLFTSRGSILRG